MALMGQALAKPPVVQAEGSGFGVQGAGGFLASKQGASAIC
jgi:hypothetical protein